MTMKKFFRTTISSSSSSSSSSRDENHHQSPLASVAFVAATAIASVSGYHLHRSIREHGWRGTLRLIWEGNPYHPELRDAVDTLEHAEFDLHATHRIDDRLGALEASLDRAQAGATSQRRWYEVWSHHSVGDRSEDHHDAAATASQTTIEKELADISNQLDKIAARVDGVILRSSSSNNNNNKPNKTTNAKRPSSCSATSNEFLADRVKARKKNLSRTIVSDMERCDALLASFQVLKEQANSSSGGSGSVMDASSSETNRSTTTTPESSSLFDGATILSSITGNSE